MLAMFAKKSTINSWLKRLNKMEMLTDFMAILGWGLFGFCLPTHLAVFRDGSCVFGDDKSQLQYWVFNAISFGLIAASFVL